MRTESGPGPVLQPGAMESDVRNAMDSPGSRLQSVPSAETRQNAVAETRQNAVTETRQSAGTETWQNAGMKTGQNRTVQAGQNRTAQAGQNRAAGSGQSGTSGPARRRVSFGEAFTPFSDGEFVQCWKIQPQDFAYLPRRESALRNNRFLLYGYYNFGHLLLGKKPNGQYILGVPGGYDQQERFMANMFGFPYFKESRLIELPKARGGYWYRLINAPDFH